jgi:sulfonate transport system ATP-binding protein
MHALVVELHRRHRPAVLLVTHDVDEALILGDRVLVLDDGRIVETDIRLGSSRDRVDPAFERARLELLTRLGVRRDDVPAGDPVPAGR